MLQLQANYLEECNEFLAQLRIDVRGAQLDSGILSGALQANQCDSAVFLRMAFDRRVHFAGGRMPGMVPCALMTSGDSWYHGNTSEGFDLCGFNTTLKDTDVHWVGEMSVMYIPEHLLRYELERSGNPKGLEQLVYANAITLDQAQRRAFARLFYRGISGTLQSDQQILNYLTLCLSSADTLRHLPEVNQDFHHFVMACRHHSKDGAMSVGAIIESANQLYDAGLTKPVLYRNKRFEADYKLNPGDYFKRFRLEEVRCALIRAEVPSIDEARRIYRFSNKKQFNLDFEAAFGESARNVLKRGQQG